MGSLIGSLVQLGAAGAAIFVMIYILKYKETSDKSYLDQIDRMSKSFVDQLDKMDTNSTTERTSIREQQRLSTDQMRALFDRVFISLTDLANVINKSQADLSTIVDRLTMSIAELRKEIHDMRDFRQAEILRREVKDPPNRPRTS